MDMISKYVREQKRYTHNELSMKFRLNSKEAISFIKKLRAYGVLKIVRAVPKQKGLTDLIDEDIEIMDMEEETEGFYYVFTFVGVLTVGDRILKCYPKYILDIKEPLEEMKQVLSVLKKYNSKEQTINRFNGYSESDTFNMLAVVLYLLNDYQENGIYLNQQEVIETNGEGEILWDNTINETYPIISNNRPFYIELQTKNRIDDDMDYFKRLHQSILSTCSKKMKEMDILELFEIEEVNISEETLVDFGDIEYVLYQLRKELKIQFSTRKQDVLKTLYAYVAHSKVYEDSFGISMYGTNSFNLVWEEVCAEVFNNQLQRSIGKIKLPTGLSDKYIKRQHKTLMEIIEHPVWRHIDEKGSIYNHIAKGTLEPDLISLYGKGKTMCFGIFDAKYYIITLDENRVLSQPGVGDITKQYLYQLAYNDFIHEHEFSYVQNAFICPSQESKIEVLGEVEMSMLYNLQEKKLKNISVVKLPANLMYKYYCTNKKIKDLTTALADLPLFEIQKEDYISSMITYLSKLKGNDSLTNSMQKEGRRKKINYYPPSIKTEIGAKIIYNIICNSTIGVFYGLEIYQETSKAIVAETAVDNKSISEAFARISLGLENWIKSISTEDINRAELLEKIEGLMDGEGFDYISKSSQLEDISNKVHELVLSLYI